MLAWLRQLFLRDEKLSNFSPRPQKVLALARTEADRLNHNFVGSEHLLLGLIRLDQGVGVNVLRKLKIDLAALRTEIETQIQLGPEQKRRGNVPYTWRVKQVLALASQEAMKLNHAYVGTEHILLGLLREGDGVAARVLKHSGLDLGDLRQRIVNELSPP